MKQVKPASGTVPSSTAAPAVGEEGQPTGEVGPIAIVTEVNPNAPSSILAKRKWDDGVGSSGRKKETAPMSPHALR